MSANGVSGKSHFSAPRGERPRLLPSNRKLRHLHGITLRNLVPSSTTRRDRRKTFDDEALPNSLKSPTKLLAVSEAKVVAHSRSFSDLNSQGRSNHSSADLPSKPASPPSVGGASSLNIQTPKRTTLQRTYTSPKQRQQKLQEAVSRRTADVFFSVHCQGLTEPLYISEVVQSSTNPNFCFFDFNACEASITRQDALVVRFWIKATSSKEWQFLIELSLHLRSLQYIGSSLDHFHHPLPDNCVLFHLSDGIYTSFSDMPVEGLQTLTASTTEEKDKHRAEPTSSYDAIMRLSTLDECVQDAIMTRRKLTAEINALIHADEQRFFADDRRAGSRDSLTNIKRLVATERKQVNTTRSKLNDLRRSLQMRREAMRKGRDLQANAHDLLQGNIEKVRQCEAVLRQTSDDIVGQRRRICEDLLTIYPIDPIPNRSLAFTIRQLALPNSDFTNTKEEVTSAALGNVAHLVHLLSLYLHIPLPYPLAPASSTSAVRDPVSLMPGDRNFPLHIRGAVFYRFEYGVFLLNKDIELLACRLGLRIFDIRQTLPNLKYVLFVATAGRGELPARKAGGVRGLLREKGTPGSSRRGSNESVGRASMDVLRGRLLSSIAGTGR